MLVNSSWVDLSQDLNQSNLDVCLIKDLNQSKSDWRCLTQIEMGVTTLGEFHLELYLAWSNLGHHSQIRVVIARTLS